MKIRNSLILLFSLITLSILFIFSYSIYFSAKENREKEFYSLLKKEGITKAKLFFDAKIEIETLQDIYKSNREILNEVEVAIYDGQFNLLYHDAVEIDFVKETPELLKDIARNKEKRFYQRNWQIIGLVYVFQNTDYIVIAAAKDQYGYNKLESLYESINWGLFISLLVIFIAGRFISKRAFDPIKEMIEKAKDISATNLHLRLKNNNSHDELSELATTFNHMLSRLENSFDSQKNFVSNISHELRTPLTAIITELELSSGSKKEVHEYDQTILNTLNDAKKMVKLINGLLDLAKASYDPSEMVFKELRVDEILLDARYEVIQANPEFKVLINFNSQHNELIAENPILMQGIEYLLKVAFTNLIENACKFSNQQECVVVIHFNQDSIHLEFKDNGIGISKPELDKIFTPFYRGENKHFATGYGIGLSLTKKIIELHRGNIEVKSQIKLGTTVSVELPIF
jgi:two-component system, OmpR family, sensor histidine kinase ArlS